MMALGGEQKREQLFRKVDAGSLVQEMNKLSLAGMQAEEQKVAVKGERGQGEYLTNAKLSRKK